MTRLRPIAVLVFAALVVACIATFGLSVNAVLISFRVALFALPVMSAMVTYRLCRELCARDGLPMESRVAFKEILSRLFTRAPATEQPDPQETAP